MAFHEIGGGKGWNLFWAGAGNPLFRWGRFLFEVERSSQWAFKSLGARDKPGVPLAINK